MQILFVLKCLTFLSFSPFGLLILLYDFNNSSKHCDSFLLGLSLINTFIKVFLTSWGGQPARFQDMGSIVFKMNTLKIIHPITLIPSNVFFYLWNLIFWVAGRFGMWKVSLDKSDIFFLQWTVRVVGEAFKLLSKKCPHLCYRKSYRLTQPIQKLLFAIMFSFVIAWNQAYIDYTSHIFFLMRFSFFL